MYYADPPAAPPPPPPPSGAGGPGAPPPGGIPPGGVPPVRPPQGLAPVLVSFPGPEPQSRGTVAIRVILAIPHLIVLYALGIAAEVVLIIGWFAALFTGRLPDFAAEFENGYLRWQTRVYAYLALMTDRYPPFALADAPYPVRIATLPGPLNRLAVLFRAILIIPAGIVFTVLSYGAFTIVLFVTWLIVLIKGRMPTALYQAFAAALRYSTRVSGYLFMLTSAYPGGLFGDEPPVPVYDQSFPPAPPAFPSAAGPGFPAPADPWRLVLSSGARKLVGWFLAIGAVLFAGMLAGIIIAASNAASTVSAVDAFNRMQSAANVLNNAERNAATQTQACGQNNLSCVTKIDAHMGGVYRTFAATMSSISMPSSQDSAAATKIAAEAGQVATVYTHLGQATTADQYLNIANSSGVQGALNTLRTDFDNLQSSLAGT